MGSVAALDKGDAKLESLTNGLPDTKQELATELAGLLEADGYTYLRSPMSVGDYEALASEIGTITLRTDVLIDKAEEMKQERIRFVKGWPGRYRPEPVRFHTDNVKVDVMGMYCVRQDAADGAILLLDTADVAEWFSNEELAVLARTDLWAPEFEQAGKPESFTDLAPVLRRRNGGYRVYYIPWLRRDSYERRSIEMLDKFADYVKHKHETDMIRLPVQQGECVFVDNHRMLHGRAAITEDSRRHMVRLYIQAPAFCG